MPRAQQPERSTDGNATAEAAFGRLYRIVQQLRSPEGCPWDREQDLSSLRGSLVEESYECVEAITEGDTPHIREELGDVFLLATMMSYMLEEQSHATVASVLDEVSEKLVRRHPHVFGESDADTSDEVIDQWNRIKAEERRSAGKDRKGLLDRVQGSLPPLRLAWEYQKKAAKGGFDWPERGQVFEKLQEETDELRAAVDGAAEAEPDSAVEEEIGDLLFTVVNIARTLGVEPDLALARTNAKFKRRFEAVERGMADRGLELAAEHLDLMDELWNAAKASADSGPKDSAPHSS